MTTSLDDNLFRRGAADDIITALLPLLVFSRTDQPSRAAVETIVKVIVPPLVHLREDKRKAFTLETIRDVSSFEKIIGLAHQETVPQPMRTAIIDYLYDLPGFVFEAVDENGEKATDPIYAKLDIAVPRQQHEHFRALLLKAIAAPAAA